MALRQGQFRAMRFVLALLGASTLMVGCEDPCIEDVCNDVLYVSLALPPGDRAFSVQVETSDGTTECTLDLPLIEASRCSNPPVTEWAVHDESVAVFAFRNPHGAHFVVATDGTTIVEQTVTPVANDFAEDPETADFCTPCKRADVLLDASNATLPEP